MQERIVSSRRIGPISAVSSQPSNMDTSEIGQSKQSDSSKDKFFRYSKDSLVKPEYPLEYLAKLYKNNYAHYFCVNIKASCTSGVGFRLVAKNFNSQETIMEINELSEQLDLESDESQSKKSKESQKGSKESQSKRIKELQSQLDKHLADKKFLDDFFLNLNPEESFSRINVKTDIDRESIGFSCWEVIRNNKNQIVEIWHMPAVTVRMMDTNTGVCQVRNSGSSSSTPDSGTLGKNQRVFFKKIGLPLIMDQRSGEIRGTTDKSGKVSWVDKDGNPGGEALPEELWANEVIIIRNYNPDSFWYGLTDITSALGAAAGDRCAAEFQEQFFDNNAVPRMAVVFKGCSFSKETEEDIRMYFTEDIQGKAHTTLLLKAPGEEIQEDGSRISAGDIVFEKLATEVTDASFRQYRQDNANQIVTSHRVPGSLIPVAWTNYTKDAAATDLEIFKSQVIHPIQSDREFIINKHLIRDNFDILTWEFRFNEIDSLDDLHKMQINKGYIDANVLTINDIRTQLGLPPKKGGDVLFRITPLGIVKIEDIEELDTGDLSAKPSAPLLEPGSSQVETLTGGSFPSASALGSAEAVAAIDKMKELVNGH